VDVVTIEGETDQQHPIDTEVFLLIVSVLQIYHASKIQSVYAKFLLLLDPAVISQGWDPAKVDKGLKSQLVELVEAGYNAITVWNGPEVSITPLSVGHTSSNLLNWRVCHNSPA
jgi:hypothetical protein